MQVSDMKSDTGNQTLHFVLSWNNTLPSPTASEGSEPSTPVGEDYLLLSPQSSFL